MKQYEEERGSRPWSRLKVFFPAPQGQDDVAESLRNFVDYSNINKTLIYNYYFML